MVLIIGISGASGAIYGIRLLEILSGERDVETHLIISRAGKRTVEQETDRKLEEVESLADYSYDINDIGARITSGSFRSEGMIISPCSMKTLSALANSYTANLLARAADVILKERRKDRENLQSLKC